MKVSVFVTCLAAAMLPSALGIEAAAAGKSKFTLKTIEGAWGFSGDGVLAAPGPDDRLPIAGIGVIIFDGEGGCDISGTNNLNGTALAIQSDVCTYTVNSDGTGTSKALFPAIGPLPAAEVPVSFVIVDGARELRLIQTAVVVSSFVAKRIEEPHRRYRRQ